MRKIVVTGLAAAAFTFTGAAFALDATGTVQSWDATTHMLTMDSGISYRLPDRFKATSFKTGQKVHLTYDIKGGKHVASKARVEK